MPSENFIFPSPLPFPVNELFNSQTAVKLGAMTPEQCVEFFWRVRRVQVDASIYVYLAPNEGDPMWDTSGSISMDSDNQDSAFAFPMRDRALHTVPCSSVNQDASLFVYGAMLDAAYPQSAGFADKTYCYSLDFRFGVGCAEITSQYLPDTGTGIADRMLTAQRYPFQLFGNTHYLNLNVPRSLIHPEEFGISAAYSGSASVSFEFFQ